MMKPLAVAVVLLAGRQTAAGFSNGFTSYRFKNFPRQKLHSSRRHRSDRSTPPRHSSTASFAENERKGGTARFTGLDGGVTNGLDYVLSLVSSDVGSTILGLVGLILCLVHRLANTDDLSADSMGQATRSDLLAVFASGAVLLNGISKLDVTSALAESVVLDGETLLEPTCSDINREKDVTWALESVLAATPAKTAVLLVDEGNGWSIGAMAGVVPRDPASRQAPSREATPILDRFRRDSSEETYLPTLQALPGRVEFTYLPPNTQGALLLPVQGEGKVTVLVLGTNTAKSFSPRDVAWCQVLASRIGTFINE